MSKYDDMLYMNRPSSPRKKMSKKDRAAQFAPFAALTGHNEAMLETQRLTEDKTHLSEQYKETLNTKLMYLQSILSYSPFICVTYFQKDALKEGGAYVEKYGTIKKIDTLNKCIIFDDKTRILIDNIIALEGDIFKDWNMANS